MEAGGSTAGTKRSPTRGRRRRWLVGVSFVVIVALAVVAFVVNGLRLGPIDRPSLAELNAVADKIGQLCPETRYYGGTQIDLLRGRVHGPRVSFGLSERERSLIDDEINNCNIATAIS